MRHYFSEAQKAADLHRFEIEDDVVFSGDFVEGGDKVYRITGSAQIDGETYHNMVLELELENELENFSLEALMEAEWDSYDFIIEI